MLKRDFGQSLPREARDSDSASEALAVKNIPRTGNRCRPKTATKGKRYRCATCHKRSPRPVKTPAPWYCPKCLAVKQAAMNDLTLRE